MNNEWLLNLKVGDEVIIPGNWAYVGRVVVVERLTKTLIVTSNDTKWRKCEGDIIGGGRSYGVGKRLREATPENKKKLRHKQLLQWFLCIPETLAQDYDPPIRLSYDELVTIKAIVDKAIGPSKKKSVE